VIPRSAPPWPLHDDLAALLAGCRSAPADDTPRLVLADWLEENADVSGLPGSDDALARAELIRVQVELSRPTNDTARVVQLRAAEQRLLKNHAARWVGELPRRLYLLRHRQFGFASQLPGGAVQQSPHPFAFNPLSAGNSWRFTRGLLRVELHAAELTDSELVAWFASPLAAWLEEASVTVSGLAALEQMPVPETLRPYLGVRYSLGATANHQPEALTEQECKTLLRRENFALVRGLTVYPSAVIAGFLRLMAGADVSSVRYLTVRATIGDDGAAWLAAAPLDNLSALDVSGTELGPDGMRLIANSPHLRRLVSLTAFRNRFGCEGLAALASSPLAESLNVLELQNTGVGDRGVAALASSPLLGRLAGPGLNLSMNPVGDGGAKALAACPHLERFTELILRECRVSDAGAKALAASPHAANLAYLDLWNNRVGDAGAKALAASRHLKGVRDLSLRDNAITAKGAAPLCKRFQERVKV
jgi:uncharacterized protein (TIGR02996 family)